MIPEPLAALGVAGVVLAACGYCAMWLGRNVAEPLVRRHLAFLDAIEASLGAQTALMERMERLLDRLTVSDD